MCGFHFSTELVVRIHGNINLFLVVTCLDYIVTTQNNLVTWFCTEMICLDMPCLPPPISTSVAKQTPHLCQLSGQADGGARINADPGTPLP